VFFVNIRIAAMLKDRSFYSFSINEAGVLGGVAYEYPYDDPDGRGIPVQCEPHRVHQVLDEALDIWATGHLTKQDLRELALALMHSRLRAD
jgi:hypothetical protein